MATAIAPMTVEDYLHSSFSPDVEYIDGQIEERNMGENDHSAWQKALVVWFEMQAVSAGIRVRPELRVQVDAHAYLCLLYTSSRELPRLLSPDSRYPAPDTRRRSRRLLAQ